MNAYWLAVAAVAAAQLVAADSGAASKPATAPTTTTSSIAVEKTSDGELTIEPINHSAIRFAFKGRQCYVDPAGAADWPKMPKADVILITHEHADHLDAKVIDQIKKDGTQLYGSPPAVAKAGFGTAIAPGEKKDIAGITVEGIPAYNLTEDRLKFHPADRKDCGFVLTFGDKRVYVAGDTEATKEMKALKDIDIAFLPINLPYTMTPAQAAEAARAFKPKVLYPYHQGKSDPNEVKRLLADEKGIEVRVLSLP
jgi:L-ascorbate metabolism protein UlaG (beta-lactamase superfamily)